ncbi:MAG: hypothetical protein AAFQ23_09435 [Cyanobacteria bacterium J06623_1]
MPKYRPPSHNRLLALEQELLAKKRWAKQSRSRQKLSFIKQKQTKNINQQQNSGNRLLQLEQYLFKRYRPQKLRKSVSLAAGDRLFKPQKQQQSAPPSQSPPSRQHSRVKSQVFDTGEAIILQYRSKVLNPTTPTTAAVELADPTTTVEQLSMTDVSSNEAQPPSLSVEDLLPSSSFVATNTTPEIPTEKAPEPQQSLSQAAELMAQIDSQPYPLEPEAIPAILGKLEPPDAPETLAKSPAPPESDRQNPHAIFDRLGKNMAFATNFDVGTIELEELFTEFDHTLDRQEKADRDSSVTEASSNLALAQRFDEFDRILEADNNNPQETEPENPPETEISPLIFPIQRSLSKEESKTVNTITPNQDPLTGMPNHEYL